nr:MAG TPA: Repressor protein CI [Siphoviridae sp. ctjRi1]
MGMSQDELAQKTGYKSRSSVNKIEMGVQGLTQSKLLLFAAALQTTPGELIECGAEGEELQIPQLPNIFPISKRRIPLLGQIACGEPIFCNEDRESYIVAGTDVRADFCLKARGDSMTGARIMDGDVVFIQKDAELVNGQIYAVEIDDEATLKRVYYDETAQELRLLAENPRYPTMVYSGERLAHVHLLGKAIAFQSDVI